MASKILNIFCDPVFFNVTKLRDWNLLYIIRHEMLRNGRKFYSQLIKNATLMVLMVFSGIGMMRISHRIFSQRNWRRLNHGLECILIQRNYTTASCGWIYRHVRTVRRSSLNGLVCVEKTRFSNRKSRVGER